MCSLGCKDARRASTGLWRRGSRGVNVCGDPPPRSSSGALHHSRPPAVVSTDLSPQDSPSVPDPATEIPVSTHRGGPSLW